jgi:putative hydrolase of the HAD superfamily
MTIKAIIFDYGQVLNAPVDTEYIADRRSRLAKILDLETEELWPYLFEGEPAQRWMTGQLDWDGYWRAVLKPRGVADPDEIESFARDVFEGNKVLHPDMVELLFELRGKYKLAVLSNASWTEPEMESKFANEYGLPEDLFDTIETSSMGTTKPDPVIYKEVLRRLDVRPEQAIFTDDLANFTVAAGELGIHSHTFTTPEFFRAFLEENDVLL